MGEAAGAQSRDCSSGHHGGFTRALPFAYNLARGLPSRGGKMDVTGILAISIPIVAILTAGAVTIARMVIKHRERMALIEMGMHPDYPPPFDDEGRVGDANGGTLSETTAPSTRHIQ